MMRFNIIIGLAMLAMNALAQRVQQRIVLPDSVTSAEADWVDIDNDGLLDILLLMKTKQGNDYVRIFQGNAAGAIFSDTVTALINERTLPIISYDAYILADYNRDNAMDIIISGQLNGARATMIYQNKGGFKFESSTTSIPYFTQARFADFDDNATPELVVSGSDSNGSYTRILKQLDDGTWEPVHDSLRLQCSSMQTLDADGDGDNDLFLSGSLDTGALTSGFYMNHGGFYFKSEFMTALRGNTSTGDLDGDGFFEVVLMGQDESGLWYTKKYQRASGKYTVHDLPTVLKDGQPFIADFDHDGIAEISYSGVGSSGETINVIQYNSGVSTPLMESISPVRFGDLKHDGNLEYLVVSRDASNLIIALENDLSTIKNDGPGVSTNALALPIFNRVFMYWDKPADDHTPGASLTYDVFLDGASNYQAGEFDLSTEKRLTVTHGNNGTKNFRLLKHVDPADLKFAIQAIDNSFHTGSVCIGVSGGPGSPPSPCDAMVVTEEISACSQEKVVLTSPPNALWFSFKDGYVSTSSEFSFSADNTEKGDTIFYFHPSDAGGCPSLKAWTIKIENDTSKIETKVKYACEGSVELSVEPGWESVVWSRANNGNLGSNDTITVNLTGPDSITVQLSNIQGCQIVRKIALKISRPDVTVSADHFKIIKGGEVQLKASGAQRYSWTPSEGLTQTGIPDPIASPTSSTQYVVTGYDSLDCEGHATVTVTVEMSGFIPNLFSPNDDGQNDHLRVYGLSSADDFSFSIYDREGSMVYRTSDLTDAVQRGWDGTKNGDKQPPGVYFWKVKGEVGPHQLLLNGKDSGSIVLIR